MNLLLDQNADIAHQTRLAIVSVAENIPNNVMESEILHGVITGLERLYNPDIYGGLDSDPFASHRDEQDGEAELGKMLVVVVRNQPFLQILPAPVACRSFSNPKVLSTFTLYIASHIIGDTAGT